MRKANKINEILKYKNQFIGIAQGIQMMEKFSEMVKQYRDPNGAVSYYDITSNSDILLNLTTELLNSIFRDCYSEYFFEKKFRTNKVYNSMLEYFFEKTTSVYTGYMGKMVIQAFGYDNYINNQCDEVKFIENLAEIFVPAYRITEEEALETALQLSAILIQGEFLILKKKMFSFGSGTLSFKEPLLLWDFNINSYSSISLSGPNIKYSSEYLLTNINEVILNFFYQIDYSFYNLILQIFPKIKHSLLVKYYNDYNDLDVISLYEKLEFNPKDSNHNSRINIIKYVQTNKTTINDYLFHCVILGCFDIYYHSNDYNYILNHANYWKIPLSQLELEFSENDVR